MEADFAQQRKQAHLLIDTLPNNKVAAVRSMLELVRDLVDQPAASLPLEGEEITEDEVRAVAASKAWLKEHEPICNEQVLAEFGLTAEDFARMARTPLEAGQ